MKKITAYELLVNILDEKLDCVLVESPKAELDLLQRNVLRLSADLRLYIGGEMKTSRLGERQLLVIFNETQETEAARV